MAQQFTSSTDGQNISVAAGADAVYTARVRSVNWRADAILVVDSIAQLRTTQFADADTYMVRGVGEYSWDPSENGTDDGTRIVRPTGVTAGAYVLRAGSTLSVPLPDGTTAAAHTITNRGKYALSSGVVSIDPRATPIPAPADVAAGMAALRASLVWGSSLGVTRTTGGHVFTQAELLALTPTAATVVAATDADGNANGVTFIPSTNSVQHYQDINPVTGVTAGQRVRIALVWKPSAIVTNQANSLTLYYTDSAFHRISLQYDGQVMSPGDAPTTGSSVRHWRRADGFCEACIEYVAGNGNLSLRFSRSNADLTYAGDGTTGITISSLSVTELTATAVTNLSTSGTATITRVAASAPYCELATFPEDGWWPDNTQVLRFIGGTAKTLLFSSPAYEGISGTAQPVRLDWMYAPYRAPASDATIWEATGTTAVLRVQLLTTEVLRVTRTTDANATATATFTTRMGRVPQAVSIVLNGTNALLYIQGALVETVALSLAGATTFTAASFGGALPARVAEFALHNTVPTAAAVRQIHLAFAVTRGWRIDPIPLWFVIGQSNSLPNGPGISLPKTGSPARGKPAIHYESYTPAGWTSAYTGWGPTRLVHHQDWVDAASPHYFNNSADIGAQGNYGAECGFHDRMGYVATARFGVAGTPILDFLPGGAQHAGMLAALDDAVATIGLPHYFAGCIYIWGETDAAFIDRASIWDQQLMTMTALLGARYGNASPKVVLNLLHKNLARTGAIAVDLVRSREQFLRDSRTDVGVSVIDDLQLAADNTHLSVGTTQYTNGYRLGDAATGIGA